ncbi:hypothetical protein SNEBB_002578 [Seison nebaliae]|nr:hypothetical protein SNEBB_002578 [Seison nebaliae]
MKFIFFILINIVVGICAIIFSKCFPSLFTINLIEQNDNQIIDVNDDSMTTSDVFLNQFVHVKFQYFHESIKNGHVMNNRGIEGRKKKLNGYESNNYSVQEKPSKTNEDNEDPLYQSYIVTKQRLRGIINDFHHQMFHNKVHSKPNSFAIFIFVGYRRNAKKLIDYIYKIYESYHDTIEKIYLVWNEMKLDVNQISKYRQLYKKFSELFKLYLKDNQNFVDIISIFNQRQISNNQEKNVIESQNVLLSQLISSIHLSTVEMSFMSDVVLTLHSDEDIILNDIRRGFNYWNKLKSSIIVLDSITSVQQTILPLNKHVFNLKRPMFIRSAYWRNFHEYVKNGLDDLSSWSICDDYVLATYIAEQQLFDDYVQYNSTIASFMKQLQPLIAYAQSTDGDMSDLRQLEKDLNKMNIDTFIKFKEYHSKLANDQRNIEVIMSHIRLDRYHRRTMLMLSTLYYCQERIEQMHGNISLSISYRFT